MYRKNIYILLLSFIVWHINAFAENNATVKNKTSMFPKATSGYVKYTIAVPQTKNDYDHKVEVIVRQEIMADCNTHQLLAKVEEKDLDGWGYTYLYVKSNPNTSMVNTKRLCTKPKEKKFIQIHNEILLRRYNSRLPIVIYVPKTFTVHYRIWSASEDIQKAIKE